jgi:hypothetical protein
MKPRIPLPPDAVLASGRADTAPMAPTVAATRAQLRQTAFHMGNVDPVTTELVRIRNARFQQCNY